MKDGLVSSLKFTKIRDYELAWVEASLYWDDSFNNDMQLKDADMTDLNKSFIPMTTNQLPVLNLPNGNVDSHKTVFVNEPKLSDVS